MRVRLGPPYQGRCVFCLSKKTLTDEDVISRTIRRRMPPMVDVMTVAGSTFVGGPTNVIHVVLTKAVCKRCNNVWMSGLEKSFVKTLGAQLRVPQSKTLDPSQQERIARWAVKTAILMTLWTAEQAPTATRFGYFVPDAHLRWLPTHTTPPPGTRVWIGAVNDPSTRVAHHQSAALGIEPTKPIAYFATMSLGHFLFQVFGTLPVKDLASRREFPIMDPPPPLDGALTSLWPGNGEDAVWPPPRAVPAATLDQISQWPAQLIRNDPSEPFRPGHWALQPRAGTPAAPGNGGSSPRAS